MAKVSNFSMLYGAVPTFGARNELMRKHPQCVAADLQYTVCSFNVKMKIQANK